MDHLCALATKKNRKILFGMLFLAIVCTAVIYRQASVIKHTVKDKKSIKAIFLENLESLPYPTKKEPKEETFQSEISKPTSNISTLMSSYHNGGKQLDSLGLNKGHNNTSNSLPLNVEAHSGPVNSIEIDRNSSLLLYKNYSQYINGHVTGYAVISVATSGLNTLEGYRYVFSVPLAILAWKRVGYETIVLISGSRKEWVKDSCLKVILDYIKELHALYLFIETDEHQRVMMSQVSRIFASSLLSEYLKDTDYLITTDVDLWPLESSPFILQQDKQILVLNSECCGSFTHHGEFFRMIPMANVAASVKTWKQLITGRNHSLPRSGDEIIAYLHSEFGDIVRRRVIKGENEGWFIDQRLISMLLYAWIKNYDIRLIDFVPRNVGLDRIDRSWWSTKRFEGKIDIHILDNIFLTGSWLRTLPILRDMYGGNEHSALYTVCLLYFNDFETALRKRNTR